LGTLLPLLLGTPLLLCGIFMPRLEPYLQQGAGCVGKWVFIGLYGVLLLAFLITSCFIRSAARDSADGADVLIVLGAGLRGEEPTLVLRYRLDAAAQYLRNNPNAAAILSGGKGRGESISEAEAMRRYLQKTGIAENRLLLEDRSSSTKENFAFSLALVQAHFAKTKKIAFVTTDFHVLRAGLVAKKLGVEAAGVAAKDVWYISINNYLRECIALWKYALVGSI
jgi:uncharacterized SAM-binding protein YcdF (DUF218 family)